MSNQDAIPSAARKAVRSIVVAGLIAPGLAGALEMEAQFSAGVGYSDNIGRSGTDPVSETIRTIGLDFNLEQQTRKLDADIRSTFDYLNYVDDTFDSEVIGGLVATADYAFVEERLFWLFQYNWGQTLQDLFQAASPGNREDVYSLVTGPRLVIPFSTRTAMTADLEYTNTRYELRPIDFESGAAMLSIGRQVRETTNVGLFGTFRRFEFKDEQFVPYDQREAFIRIDNESQRNILSLDIGYTEVDTEEKTGDGMLIRADWTRNISALTSLQFNAGTQYSDQGDIFRFFQNVTQELDNTNSIIGFGSPFRSDYASARLQYTAERTTVQATLLATREDYELEEALNLNRDYYGIEFILNRELSRKFFSGIAVGYRSVNYETNDRTDKDLRFTFDLGFRFTPAFNIALQYQYFDRRSTDAGTESSENRAMLRFGYVPSWGR
jgi:hypothetical protein